MYYNIKNNSLTKHSGHYRRINLNTQSIPSEPPNIPTEHNEIVIEPKNNNIVGGELNDFQKKLSNLTISNSNNSIQSNHFPGSRKKNINFVL